MRRILMAFFGVVLAVMLAVTVAASLERDVVTAGAALWADGWFRATLADAYFAFLTFYVWVAYKERRAAPRLLWLVLILLLGNFAMAAYMLRALARIPPDLAGEAFWRALWLRDERNEA